MPGSVEPGAALAPIATVPVPVAIEACCGVFRVRTKLFDEVWGAVVDDRDDDRLRRLARREAERAADRAVVGARGGRPVGTSRSGR